jgi:hypothetical protein
MNANELADKLMSSLTMEYDCDKYMEQAATMLRQQQTEIEALKMGFANSGTHDSELAETRAMAGRLFLKVQDLEFEQEGYENLTEMLESEKAELTEKNCQQQAEIEALKKEKWLTEIDAKQQALKKIIDWLILEHDTLACTSYPLRKAQE